MIDLCAAPLAWCLLVGPVVVPSPPEPERVVWDDLAECEANGQWDYGPHSGWGSGIYDGGLQFLPATWTAFAPDGFPARAYDATRGQQTIVAKRVLDVQGWGAWPACSRKLGLR